MEALEIGRILKASRTLLIWLWSGMGCVLCDNSVSLKLWAYRDARLKYYGQMGQRTATSVTLASSCRSPLVTLLRSLPLAPGYTVADAALGEEVGGILHVVAQTCS